MPKAAQEAYKYLGSMGSCRALHASACLRILEHHLQHNKANFIGSSYQHNVPNQGFVRLIHSFVCITLSCLTLWQRCRQHTPKERLSEAALLCFLKFLTSGQRSLCKSQRKLLCSLTGRFTEATLMTRTTPATL
jgi:hypothetical protein